MILAALFGQLTVATKIACSQTLYFLFKVHRAHMIKNKNVLEKNEKKIEQRLCTGYYENAKRLNLVLVSTTTKASRKQHDSLKRKHVFGSSSQSLSFFVSTLIRHQCKMAAVLAFTGIDPTSTRLT